MRRSGWRPACTTPSRTPRPMPSSSLRCGVLVNADATRATPGCRPCAPDAGARGRLSVVEAQGRDDDVIEAGRVPPSPAENTATELRAAAEELDTVGDRPLEEHVEAYERLHARMEAALRSVDQ